MTSNTSLRDYRHNQIVVEGGKFLNSITKSDVGQNLTYFEHSLPKQHGAVDKVRNSVIPDVAIACQVSEEIASGVGHQSNVLNNNNFTFFDVSVSHAYSKYGSIDMKKKIKTMKTAIDHQLNIVETDKIKKYSGILGPQNIKRFSPIVFDITGYIGPQTRNMLNNKFANFPGLHPFINKNVYDKSLKWFLSRISFIMAKSNYAILKKYLEINGKFCVASPVRSSVI